MNGIKDEQNNRMDNAKLQNHHQHSGIAFLINKLTQFFTLSCHVLSYQLQRKAAHGITRNMTFKALTRAGYESIWDAMKLHDKRKLHCTFLLNCINTYSDNLEQFICGLAKQRTTFEIHRIKACKTESLLICIHLSNKS